MTNVKVGTLTSRHLYPYFLRGISRCEPIPQVAVAKQYVKQRHIPNVTIMARISISGDANASSLDVIRPEH